MNGMRRTLLSLAVTGAVLTALPAGAMAADTTVKASGVKFEPTIAYVAPGDTISFTNMASHNVETLDAMVPEGTEKVNSEIGENISVSFDEPGIYVYKCTPHWSNRMGGVVVVGEPENPGKIVDDYFAVIETDRAGLLPAKGMLKDLREDLEGKGML